MKNLIKKILKETEDDFDWVSNSEPLSKSEIEKILKPLESFGYHPSHSTGGQMLINTLHSLGLSESEINNIVTSLRHFSEMVHADGFSTGVHVGYEEASSTSYDHGYRDGESDTRSDMESKLTEKYDEGFNDGYEEGETEGYQEGYRKGYEEGVEETYYKAFEEGRAYEAGIEVEDLERRESGFDPGDYDEDYDENY